MSKFEQFKELKAGCEIAVATPGRMMDLIRMKACTTQRVTYLVLDEADRMFDMGFEQQVRLRVQGLGFRAVVGLTVCVFEDCVFCGVGG